MSDNFFILSLPRSRTAWLSALLSNDKGICYHEAFNQCKGVDSYSRLMDDASYKYVGDSNSAWILLYDKLKNIFPEAKFLIVLRKPNEVIESLRRILPVTNIMRDLIFTVNDRLVNLSKSNGWIEYEKLNDYHSVKVELCGLSDKIEITKDRFNLMSQFNVQRSDIWSNMTGYMNHSEKQFKIMEASLCQQ